MTKALAFGLFLLIASVAEAQSTQNKINIGIEQDILPYATGGYFAGVSAGKIIFVFV